MTSTLKIKIKCSDKQCESQMEMRLDISNDLNDPVFNEFSDLFNKTAAMQGWSHNNDGWLCDEGEISIPKKEAA